MNRILSALAAVALASSLTACGGDGDSTAAAPEESVTVVATYGEMQPIEYRLEDNRVVTCVLYNYDRSGAPSCDWDNAVPAAADSTALGGTVEVGAYGEVLEVAQELEDGREVTCVVYNYDRGGAPSCDWANASKG